MGLDMSLVKRQKIKSNIDPKFVDTEEVAYWRKANAIHNWFVVNLIDTVDNCKLSTVTYDDLIKLKTTCEKVLKNKNDTEYILKNLPPVGGFFFGSTDIDENYIYDVETTIKHIDKILNELDFESYDLFYEPWW